LSFFEWLICEWVHGRMLKGPNSSCGFSSYFNLFVCSMQASIISIADNLFVVFFLLNFLSSLYQKNNFLSTCSNLSFYMITGWNIRGVLEKLMNVFKFLNNIFSFWTRNNNFSYSLLWMKIYVFFFLQSNLYVLLV
jgi:hypothetical protein